MYRANKNTTIIIFNQSINKPLTQDKGVIWEMQRCASAFRDFIKLIGNYTFAIFFLFDEISYVKFPLKEKQWNAPDTEINNKLQNKYKYVFKYWFIKYTI